MKPIILILAAATFALTLSAEDSEGVHLFILSGQSNMHELKPENSFTPAVEKEFGKDGVIVVKAAWSGQPIRKWYSRSKKNKRWTSGHLYTKMMTEVKENVKDRKVATVTFVWMQGETDAAEERGDVYEKSLKGLLELVKKDMGIEELNVVIGRINDCDMENKKYPHWTMVRDIQVKVAEADPNGAWVNTDDLNDDKKHPRTRKLMKNPMHFSGKGYKIMGQRFAEKAIELIKKHK